MRILMITLGFFPAVRWGGPVKIVHQNAKELVRRGHRVTVYCTNLFDKKNVIQPGTFEREFDGIRVVYFNTWRLPWWPGTLGPIWLPGLMKYLAKEMVGFDVVHLNGYRSFMFLPIIKAAKRLRIPIITQPHGTMPVIVNSFLVKHAYDRLFGSTELDGIDALIALQESEKQQALAHGVPSEKIHVIYNGLDLIERSVMPTAGRFRKRFAISEDKPLILFLGRINKKKGPDMLIEAFARMNDQNAILAIVGPDDGQLNEVRTLVAKYNLDNRVIFTGLLSGSDVLAAYQDADLFVLPCRADTFPTTIMEACLAETPMVITDRCEISDLVKDRVADVVPFDVDQFALAMSQLLSDNVRYQHYQANCRPLLQDKFSLSSTVDQMESLYERVVATKKTLCINDIN